MFACSSPGGESIGAWPGDTGSFWPSRARPAPPAGGATGASALGEAAGVQGLWEQELDPKASPVLGQVAM